jgi:hypothetical protein
MNFAPDLMPRPPRVDEEGGFYHALNRGHGRSQIFWTDDDDSALERILAEGLARYDVSVFSFPIDAKSLASRVAPECHRSQRSEGDRDSFPGKTMSDQTEHREPKSALLSSWPVPRPSSGTERVNPPLTEQTMGTLRRPWGH